MTRTFAMLLGRAQSLLAPFCCCCRLWLALQFAHTCGDTSSLPGDQPFPCLTIGGCDPPPFETSCFQFNPNSADVAIDPEDPQTSLDDLVPVCCVSDGT
jgi:hypothetical protein